MKILLIHNFYRPKFASGENENFKIEKKILKEKGHIIFFHPHCWHRVTPITKGVRKSLVGWFCGSPWK